VQQLTSMHQVQAMQTNNIVQHKVLLKVIGEQHITLAQLHNKVPNWLQWDTPNSPQNCPFPSTITAHI